MDADVWFQLELLIYEIATEEGGLRQRALLPLHRLALLRPEQFPNGFGEKLLQLQAESRTASSMSIEEARQFIARIVNFQQILRLSGE